MNFFCISTIICVIVFATIILTNIVGDYVAKKQHRKSEQQLNEFRNEANKTRQDLNILLNLALHNEGHGKRHRRQALDYFASSDTAKAAEMVNGRQMVPNCNSDICKHDNCGPMWYSDRNKDSLNPTKQFNNFLSSLKSDNGKMTRQINSAENERYDEEENAWKSAEDTGGIVKEEIKAENKEENEIVNKKNIRSKDKSPAKDNGKGYKSEKFSWTENAERNKLSSDESLKENSNMFDEELNAIRTSPDAEYTNSDVSGCQHCPQNTDNGNLKNNFKSYKHKPIESKNPKYMKNFSKQTKKLEEHQPFLKSFEQKYSIEEPESEDEEEEENSLYQIKYPSVALTQSQYAHTNEVKNCKPIAAESKLRNKSSPNVSQLVLNDQVENSKNNLSHEANYKLSKDEQDASENKKGFSWKWGIFKRSHPFNAMNEIKLKTSRRLMQKGFGPSLPSYSLGETRKDMMIDNMLRRREKELLGEKNKKYKSFEQSLKNNEIEDAPVMTLAAGDQSRPLNDWTSIRQKRISYPSARYKRELSEVADNNEAKAFNKSILLFENHLELFNNSNNLKNTVGKAPVAKTVGLREDSNQSANATPYKMDHFLNSLPVNDKIKVQPGVGKYKNTGNTTVKAFDTQPNAFKLVSFEVQDHTNNSHILNSDNLVLKNSSSELKAKALKAQNYYHSYLKPMKRIKRRVGRKSSHMKKAKHSLNKSKIITKYDANFYAKNKYFEKLYSPRALKYSRVKGESTRKHFKHSQRFRAKRSLQPTFLMAKNSADSGNFFSTATKSLWRKARHVKKSIKDFFKSIKYLPFQRSVAKSFNNLQDFRKQTLASEKIQQTAFDDTTYKSDEIILYKDQSSSKANEIGLEDRADIPNNLNKIRNPKLRFLKENANTFILLTADLRKYDMKNFKESHNVRQKRAGQNFKTLSENYTNDNNSVLGMMRNGSEYNLNIFKSFWAEETKNIIPKSSFEAYINFFKTLFGYSQLNGSTFFENYIKSFFQKRKSTHIDQSSPKLFQWSNEGNTNYTENLSTPTNLIDLPAKTNLSSESSTPEKSFICNNSKAKSKDNNINKYSNGNGVTNKKNEPKFSQQNETTTSKSLKDQYLETNKVLIKGNSNQLQSNTTALEKHNWQKLKSFNGTLSLDESFNLHNDSLSDNKSFSKILQEKSKPPKSTRNLKRSKRSLSKALQEDHINPDKEKHLRKRSYFFHHGDLYNTDFAYNKGKNLDNIFNEPSQIFGSEDMPIDQERAKPTAENNFQKLFDGQELNNLKTNYPAEQKIQPTKFNNIWLDSNSRKRHAQSSKIKHKSSKNSWKRHNFDHLKDSLTGRQTKSLLPNATITNLRNPYLSELNDFNKNYKFNENMFNWSTGRPTTEVNALNNSTDDDGKLSLELQDKILNCKEFNNLEEFIKSLPKNLTQSLLGVTTKSSLDTFTDKIEVDIKTSVITTEMEAETTEETLVLGSTVKCSTTTEGQVTDEQTETSAEPTEDVDFEQTTSESSSPDEDSDTSSTDSVVLGGVTTEHLPLSPGQQDNIKLNITIKANVHGNRQDNRYFGNGSFDVIPAFMDDRRRRHILLSPEQDRYKKRIRQKPLDEQSDEELSDLMSGKLSSKIVNNIFNSVQQSPHLKALWPSLKRDQQQENKVQQPNFYAIRNQENEEQLENSEKLLDQVLSSLNSIIEQQARAKACVPLRPDLQEFYNMILQSRQQQNMIREKRHPAEAKQRKGFNNPSLDPSKIEQETKIVKKLLKKYDELPQEDQQQVAVVRDDLIKNLMVLHRLQDNELQEADEFRDRRESSWDASDEDVLKGLQSQYSPEFLKLLDAAELYREIKSD